MQGSLLVPRILTNGRCRREPPPVRSYEIPEASNMSAVGYLNGDFPCVIKKGPRLLKYKALDKIIVLSSKEFKLSLSLLTDTFI